jgi:hypothetical protein
MVDLLISPQIFLSIILIFYNLKEVIVSFKLFFFGLLF